MKNTIVYILFSVILLASLTSAKMGLVTDTAPHLNVLGDYATLDGYNIFTGQNLFNGGAPQTANNLDICRNSFNVYTWGSDDGSCMGGIPLRIYWNNESRHLQFLDGNEDVLTIDANINGTIGGGSFVKKTGDEMSGDLNFTNEFHGIGYRSLSGVDTTLIHADGGNIRLQADGVEIPNSILSIGEQSGDGVTIGNTNAILGLQGTIGGASTENLQINLGQNNYVNVTSSSGVTAFNIQGMDLKQNGVNVCLSNGTNCGASGNQSFNQTLTDTLYLKNGNNATCFGPLCTSQDMNRGGVTINDSQGLRIYGNGTGTNTLLTLCNENGTSGTTTNIACLRWTGFSGAGRPELQAIYKDGTVKGIFEFRGGSSSSIFVNAEDFVFYNNKRIAMLHANAPNGNGGTVQMMNINTNGEAQIGPTYSAVTSARWSVPRADFFGAQNNLTSGYWDWRMAVPGGSTITYARIDNTTQLNYYGKINATTINATTVIGTGIHVDNPLATVRAQGWSICQGSTGFFDGYFLLVNRTDCTSINTADVHFMIDSAGAVTANYGYAIGDAYSIGSSSSGALAYYRPYNGDYLSDMSFRSRSSGTYAGQFRQFGYSYYGGLHTEDFMSHYTSTSGVPAYTYFTQNVTLNNTLTVNSNEVVKGSITSQNASAWSGRVVCYTTDGALGHCTSVVDLTGGCTCVAN
jgi:hypothetical protein